ncbi:oxidoreductase family protein [Candidatus Poriferisodalis sp.]|uniref:oxidoreductase family protein n=1 Tax=Candidatus Poriferisodalis sp. TaxID=3101277 RepID=UPI003B012862
MDVSIPACTADVSAEWLTAVLRDSGTIGAQTSVTSIACEPSAIGVGFMGEVGRVEVRYANATGGEPASVVVKFPTANPEVAAMMRPTRVYEREHRFYAELAHLTPLRTPRTYHITCETSPDPDEDERYLLVLEDLSSMTLGDQLAGLSAEQTASALTGLGAHHARFWNGAGLEAASFVPDIDGPLNLIGQSIYAASLPGFLSLFDDALEPETRKLARDYEANHPQLLRRLGAMPRTLVHFDYRADNLFFDDAAADVTAGGVGEVAAIDFQAISAGGGAADVGYLLSQNLESSTRRLHEIELLHCYHDALAAGGVRDYPFEQLLDDYRVGLIYGWVIPVFATGTLDSSSERAMALWTAAIERVTDAVFQHGAHELLTERKDTS